MVIGPILIILPSIIRASQRIGKALVLHKAIRGGNEGGLFEALFRFGVIPFDDRMLGGQHVQAMHNVGVAALRYPLGQLFLQKGKAA